MNIFRKPNLIIPVTDEPEKWAVIACDQFTGQPKYWEKLEKFVGGAPSALDLMLPEIYLKDDNSAATEKIHKNMQEFLKSGNFREINGYVLVERTLNTGKKRLGLMLEINLDAYEYTEKNNAPIKATEKTVPERLPPRIKIREGAALEMPHAMLLMDDPQKTVIEKLYEKREGFELLYDFELNMNGGHLRGWLVPEGAFSEADILKLEKNGMLFAVGDGNHSLAAAKDSKKFPPIVGAVTDRPHQKYALAELVNLHDESLVFEPIHRVVFGADESFLDGLKITSENPADKIADIQNFLDEHGAKIDYIHGDNHLTEVARETGGLPIFMPAIDKKSLFEYVARRGVLPRKAFSVGNAEDKRYYFEMRKL